MNTETNPTETNTPTTGVVPAPPANIDATIQEFLNRAFKFASNENADPKALCALGWLVLKIKEVQIEAASSGKPLTPGLSPETIQGIERADKIL